MTPLTPLTPFRLKLKIWNFNSDLSTFMLDLSRSTHPKLLKVEINTHMAKQGTAFTKWCFTFNNPDVDHIKLEEIFAEKVYEKLVFQLEVGAEGTPHYQGAIQFKKPLRLTALTKIAGIHWANMKGTWKQNLTYCTKPDTRKEGPWFFGTAQDIEESTIYPTRIKEEDRTPWQKEIWEMMAGQADHRKIFWYWDESGNVGKTSTAYDLHTAYPSGLIVSGKASDIKAAIALSLKMQHPEPHFVIWDIPRDSKDYMNYAALEEIKNGIFFSGKYESGMIKLKTTPHIVVFANFPPETDRISQDRWIVTRIGDPPLYPVFCPFSQKLD